MNFHFASWNNESLWPITWNDRCSVSIPVTCLPSLWKQWAGSGYISNITSLCPFLDGGSTLLAGTMSLWLNKMACGQPGWKTMKSVWQIPCRILAHKPWGEQDIRGATAKLFFLSQEMRAVAHLEITFGRPPLGCFPYHRTNDCF